MSYKYQRYDDAEEDIKASSHQKCVGLTVLGCIILGGIVGGCIYAFGNGSTECEWKSIGCAVQFPHVGYYCAEASQDIVEYGVSCLKETINLQEKCFDGTIVFQH